MPQPRSPRRSQEVRSALTRARILDAALLCLAERGYAGTTTTAIAERAGVSRGAQLHHFPTRQELLAAAVQHLYAALPETFLTGFAALPPDADRIHAALALLWEIYLDPTLIAVSELQMAARTDRALREALLPVGERHHANIHALARDYFSEAAAASPKFTEVLDLILDAYEGLRARKLLRPADPAIPRTLAMLEAMARDALGPESGEPRHG